MRKITPAFAVLMLGVAGCSTLRTNLSPEGLTPGSTGTAQAVGFFGQPQGIDTITGPAIPAPSILYSYGFPHHLEAPELFRGAWKVPQRTLVLEFVNDTLHGYLHNNSTDDHPTAFTRSLRWRVHIGRSTRDDVLALLGEPSGRLLLPTRLLDYPKLAHLRHVMPSQAREAWCYCYDYSYFMPNVKKPFEYYRFLAVYFNADGVVVDKFYGESEKTEPNVIRIFDQ